ncbi:MAG: DUF58 domain-containing protein [Candidatus Omnitrophica bacterium]|nr:DUF58 domain-containing protein [Candidatus Omnitrophota bacterium]MCB9721245.1 DUF58 domain-containing protein [Candidatus Omnitrophota bacterium]
MIPKELFRKVRQIEITTSRLVTDAFAGQYHSVFKGQGIEFDEVREYQIGDDIRSIDWNVTARTGKPYIKKFIEERELTVMIMVDLSASAKFSSSDELKSQLAAEMSALLALSAIRNNDKVGLIIFTDEIELFIPPRKGRGHVLRLIREVLYFRPQRTSTNIRQALEFMSRVTTRKAITFLISDFLGHNLEVPQGEVEDSFRKTLSIAHQRHDLIAVTLNDPHEQTLPDCGLVLLEDAETGRLVCVDAGSAGVRRRYAEANRARIEKREQLFRSLGIDFINISTAGSYVDEVVRFFRKRLKKIRR